MVLAELHRLHDLLLPGERRRVWLVAVLIAVAALVQLVALVALYAFLAGVASPDVALPGPVVRLAGWLGVEGTRGQVVAFAGGCFVLLLASNAMSALVERARFRLEGRVHTSLATRLMAAYLSRDYPFFVANHSSRLSRALLHGTREVTVNVLRPALDLLNKLTMSVVIVGLLVALDPLVSSLVALILVGGLAGVYLVLRTWVRRQGRVLGESQRDQYKAVAEALGGIKELKVVGREASFVQRFDAPMRRLTRAHGSVEFAMVLNKYALETTAFGAILLVVAWLILGGAEVADIIPIVGLLAIAGYRLLPAVRDISNAVSSFAYGSAALHEIWGDLQAAQPSTPAVQRLPLARGFGLADVSFAYDEAHPVLRGVSLEIPVGAVVGISGGSGAGKSTLADLLMGLIRPTLGSVVVDGQPLTEADRKAWQRNIGYVPQEIFLTDGTIEQNIAFGIPADQVDQAAVQRAAQSAQIADVIERMPAGYQTVVGERGVKLSGGQRQRIGIARALYHDPSVLVLDEATSDVDGATEARIAQAVRALGGRKTVVVIAHRVAAIRACDFVYFLEKGQVRASGTYEELSRDPAFQRTVEGAHAA